MPLSSNDAISLSAPAEIIFEYRVFHALTTEGVKYRVLIRCASVSHCDGCRWVSWQTVRVLVPRCLSAIIATAKASTSLKTRSVEKALVAVEELACKADAKRGPPKPSE